MSKPKIIAVEPELMGIGSGMYIPRLETIYYDKTLDNPKLEFLKDFIIKHELEHHRMKFKKNTDILKHLVHEIKEQLKIRFSLKIKKQATLLQKISYNTTKEKTGLTGKGGDLSELIYYSIYMISATLLELLSTPLTLFASYKTRSMRFYLMKGGILSVIMFSFIMLYVWRLFI